MLAVAVTVSQYNQFFVENEVVKDDRRLNRFLSEDCAVYRDVALFLDDCGGLIRIFRAFPSDFLTLEVVKVVLCVTLGTSFVASLALLLLHLFIATVVVA